MTDLNQDGQRIVAETAGRHGVSVDAAAHVLRALHAGQGRQAQFNHPDLGGLGQWSQGGMTMIGDMFNTSLKARVAALCADLAGQMGGHALFDTAPSEQGGSSGSSLFVAGPQHGAWPPELGQPGSSGSQNDLRYASFPATRRLAIVRNGQMTVYDTGEHRITGFGQAQGGGQSLSFTSQHGLVRLSDLPVVAQPSEPDPVTAAPPRSADSETARPAAPTATDATAPATGADISDDQIFARIERLADLFAKGILSQAEYDAKKAELLSRL